MIKPAKIEITNVATIILRAVPGITENIINASSPEVAINAVINAAKPIVRWTYIDTTAKVPKQPGIIPNKADIIICNHGFAANEFDHLPFVWTVIYSTTNIITKTKTVIVNVCFKIGNMKNKLIFI